MARKPTTTALTTGTVKAPTTPPAADDNKIAFIGRGNNSSFAVPDEAIIRQTAIALSDWTTSSRTHTTGIGRMAYAIMGAHERAVFNETCDTALSAGVASTEAFANLRRALVDMIGDTPDTKDKTITGREKARMYKARLACFNRGLEIACINASLNVSPTNFNVQNGYWSVLGLHLFTPEQKAMIRDDSAVRTTLAELSRGVYGASGKRDPKTGNEDTVLSQRSLDVYKRVNWRKPKRAPQQQGNKLDAAALHDHLSKMKAEALQEMLGAKDGLKLAVRIIHSVFFGADGKPTGVKPEDHGMKKPDMNMAQDVAKALTEMLHPETPATKAVTKAA